MDDFRTLLFCLLMAAVPLAAIGLDKDQIQPYIERSVSAARLSEPPTIDGDISDAVWREAATDDGFTDQKTYELMGDQTRFWLGYDDAAIYLAVHCLDDEPERLVLEQTKRDARIFNDDHITFELDPYHTHKWEEFSAFSVTARGTQASQMGGGRSGKTEWKGDWQAAANVTQDGWVAEMAIPWAILVYPSKKEPTTIGFNLWRAHARLDYSSLYSNIGQTYRNEWAANWIGVELPASSFEPELLVMPFIAAGAAERDDIFERTARGGADFRYRPTPQITGLVTLNPDFQNVEGEVEGIDFTRGERFLDESRPFFQEGGDMFQTWSGAGDYFYSRRIENIDMGGKLYGKLAKRTNLGVMGALDFADQHGDAKRVYRQDYLASLRQGFGEWGGADMTLVRRDSASLQNTVTGYRLRVEPTSTTFMQMRYGSSAWSGAEEDATQRTYKRGDLATVNVGIWESNWWIDLDAGYLSPGFESANGFFEYQGRRFASFYSGVWIEKRESWIRNVGFDFWGNYAERYETGSGFADFDSLFNRAFSQIGKREGVAGFFRDNIGLWTGARFSNEMFINQSVTMGHFREEDATPDFDWSHNINFNLDNEGRTRGIRIGHRWGQSDGTRRHFTSIGGSIKRDDISVSLDTSILRHKERKQQHILGVNYDFTDTVGAGGRVVFQRDDKTGEITWNPYLSFRRAGEAGIETFLILGDPSGDKFIPRLEGKMLFPL